MVSTLTKGKRHRLSSQGFWTGLITPQMSQTSVDKSVVKQNTIIQVALADTSKLMHSNLKNLPCLRKNTLAV